MVETQLTCKACGQHFETKSDLQDHEKKMHPANQAESSEKQRRAGKQSQTSSQQGGEKARGAGIDSSWRGESDV
jgi:hypothetical protein